MGMLTMRAVQMHRMEANPSGRRRLQQISAWLTCGQHAAALHDSPAWEAAFAWAC